MKSRPKIFDRRITLSRKDKQKICNVFEDLMWITSFLTKKSLNKYVLAFNKIETEEKVYSYLLWRSSIVMLLQSCKCYKEERLQSSEQISEATPTKELISSKVAVLTKISSRVIKLTQKLWLAFTHMWTKLYFQFDFR